VQHGDYSAVICHRQENCGFLCGYRFDCAIKLITTEFTGIGFDGRALSLGYLIVTSDIFIKPTYFGTEFYLYLYLPVGTLASYPGSDICSTSNPCGPNGTDVSTLRISASDQPVVTSGTLELAPSLGTSLVPEPSSILLLGIGLLSVIGVMRRRLA
jgi:hypothetical protein